MSHNLISTPEHFISSLDGQLITSSLLVAEAFKREHKNILQRIESLDIPDSFSSANFSAHVQKISIGNGAQRESKVYRMTKDGFMLLVMGFTGKRAMDIKIAYINAFNRMAHQLAQQTSPRLDGRSPQSNRKR